MTDVQNATFNEVVEKIRAKLNTVAEIKPLNNKFTIAGMLSVHAQRINEICYYGNSADSNDLIGNLLGLAGDTLAILMNVTFIKDDEPDNEEVPAAPATSTLVN